MRTRINKYTIVGERQVKLDTPITIEDVRLIINETKKIVIASSMQKDNITIEGGVITYTDALPISEVGDYFTIEIDKGETIKDILGDANVLLSDVSDGKAKIAEAINTKGGNSTPDESFQQLAEDIVNINDSFITYGVTVVPKINWLEFICNNSVETRSSLLEIDDYLVKHITSRSPFSNSINLSKVNFHNLETIENEYTFTGCSSLNTFISEKLNTIVGYSSGTAPFRDIPLKFFICPSLTRTGQSALFFGNNYPITNIVAGKLTFVNFFMSNVFKLRNITIGQDTDINLPFQNWVASDVIAEGQSGVIELNSNLYNNLLTKLYDHSTDGQTRTLRLGWLAHVTQENIDYANSKGWTLTT